MPIGSVFKINRTQVVRLPVETRFPDSVKKVNVRIVGADQILSPFSFFDGIPEKRILPAFAMCFGKISGRDMTATEHLKFYRCFYLR